MRVRIRWCLARQAKRLKIIVSHSAKNLYKRHLKQVMTRTMIKAPTYDWNAG
jgi:hypothetical protein